MTDFSVSSESPERTRALGAALAHVIAEARELQHAPLIIGLRGDLGAGKTTFVGGFLRALGVRGAVKSPTYTLIEPYELSECTVFHLDLYRVADPGELEMLALRDLLTDGAVLLIEWPERGGSALPALDLCINLEYSADNSPGAVRRIRVEPRSLVGRQLAATAHKFWDQPSVSP